MNLRKLAEGRECQVRSPVCNFDPMTTVLAHIRLAGISGIGHKVPDVMGAHCCSSCHTLVDTGSYAAIEMEREDRNLLLLEGVMRTQNWLIKEGYLQW